MSGHGGETAPSVPAGEIAVEHSPRKLFANEPNLSQKTQGHAGGRETERERERERERQIERETERERQKETKGNNPRKVVMELFESLMPR